jgi:hypothetical protein
LGKLFFGIFFIVTVISALMVATAASGICGSGPDNGLYWRDFGIVSVCYYVG